MKRKLREVSAVLIITSAILLIGQAFRPDPSTRILTEAEEAEIEYQEFRERYLKTDSAYMAELEKEKAAISRADSEIVLPKTTRVKSKVRKKLVKKSSEFRADPWISDTVSGRYRRKVTATIYNATRAQCDRNPGITADGSKICNTKLRNNQIRWIAMSRDLIRSEHFGYGDKVRITCESDPRLNGVYEVHDTMHERYRNFIDILVHPSQNGQLRAGRWNVIIEKIG